MAQVVQMVLLQPVPAYRFRAVFSAFVFLFYIYLSPR